jgi:hypothetical protein
LGLDSERLKMSPKEISEVLFKIFSEEGYQVQSFKIKSKSPIVANVYSDDSETSIKFGTNYPKVEITRLITLYTYIEGLIFRKDGGVVRLKNFPDISFGYEESLLSILFSQNFSCHPELHVLIDETYTDATKKKIAEQCLHYGTEWATIVSQSRGFSNLNNNDRKNLRSQCINFVVDNVRNDIEKEYGSVILTYLLVFIVIPAIARFIITRLLEKYF